LTSFFVHSSVIAPYLNSYHIMYFTVNDYSPVSCCNPV